MSHLILDIGNTHAKAAIMEEMQIVETNIANSVSDLNLQNICEKHYIEKAIASVVGRQPDFDIIIPNYLLPHFHQLSINSKLPITIDYETPDTLGMDRVAAAIGARQLAPEGALLIVDAGSCITIDLLDEKNCFQGGAILPGLHFRLRSMHEYTSALPIVTLSDDEKKGTIVTSLTGKSTRASMIAGTLNASLFEIQGFIDEYKKIHPSLKLFLTGGDAVFFANRLFFPNFAVSSLVFIGLDNILNLNCI